MNYWDNLPCELQNIVLGFVATTIQKNWRGSLASPAKQSLKFVKELFIEIKPDEPHSLTDEQINYEYIDTMAPRTALIVGYCAKHAYWRIGRNNWRDYINTIKHDLWLNEFTGGPGAIYYGEIEINLSKLHDRLSWGYW
uniref:Uncharacterized protein n=1 Tax=viral metagenome TaxID=1070528 RepID=A0A6C0C457_9ZZZZ